MTDIYTSNPNDAISAEELALYQLLMDYRATQELGEIQLSTALSTTAGRHAVDTHDNIWQAGVTLPEGANLHSWSDAYYYSDHRDPSVMWDAPERIGTGYTSNGYEISAAGYASIEAALAGWQGSPGHDAVIMNTGTWSNVTWNAIGIGVIQSDDFDLPYAGRIYHVWFGTVADPGGAPLIQGNGEAEFFDGTNYADTVMADAGDDTVEGHGGADMLMGGLGADSMMGGAGNDTLNGGSNPDVINGGSGDDWVTYADAASGARRISLGGTAGEGGASHGDILQSIEHAIGSNFGDLFIGTGGANTLNGLQGNDTFFAGAGNDTIDGGSGDDVIDAGDGADSITGGAGIDTARYASSASVQIDLGANTATGGFAAGDTFFGIENIVGSQFDDTIVGNDQDNLIEGIGGDDMMMGGLGADTIIGYLGTDTASYQDSGFGVNIGISRIGTGGTAEGDQLIYVERIIGSVHNDEIIGGGAAPILEGSGGNDTIIDYGGAATILGGSGDDTINAGSGADNIDGGDGIDTIRYANTSAVQIDLEAGTGSGFAAEGDVISNVENVVGSNAGDVLTGDAAANRLEGLFGEDTIKGGLGDDVLLGGGNADTFVFDAVGWGRDLVLDWQDNFDKIDLRGSGLTDASFTMVDTAQGVRLDYFNGATTDAIHLFGASLSPGDIDSSDFLF